MFRKEQLAFVAATFAAMTASPSLAQTIIVHDIVVAANPLAAYSNSRVDTLLSRINSILAKADYTWDTACTGVRFRRAGDVIKHNSIPESGSDDDLFKARTLYAPNANIILALDVTTCSGFSSVDGCGSVGTEGFAIQPSIDDASVWLHERGHNMNLDHAEGYGKHESEVPQEWAKRVMFWQVGPGHTGLSPQECSAFKVKRFSSIKSVAAVAAAEAAETDQVDPVEALLSGLTPKARETLNPAPHGYDLAKIVGGLNKADLDSLNAMLDSGKPNPGWSRAIDILSFAARPDDEAVLRKILTMAAPVMSGALTDAHQDQMVVLRQIKLAAVKAVPAYCARAKNDGCASAVASSLTSPEILKDVEPAMQAVLIKNAAEALTATGNKASINAAQQLIPQIKGFDAMTLGKNADTLRGKFQMQ